MRNYILILTFSIFALMLQAQTKSTNDIYKLKGVLKYNGIESSPCGFEIFATVYEFKILEFSNAGYTNKSIAIKIACPELYGQDFFENGKIYEMSVETESNFSGLVFNEQNVKKRLRKSELWLVNDSIEKIK